MLNVGENLKKIREDKAGLRQEDVAKALGISTKAYSNIENNIADITLTRLKELSDIFGVTPEFILNYQDKATYNNTFNNYEGNHGVINMYQGASDQVKNLESQLKGSQEKLEVLKSSIKVKNN
ncbi:helix-turn-helix transcriptional regulator [Algoriphagus sp. D3-2-R+10]|uniref:helix-turn-helix domain-containing protein n=1 Tax=Algoriphagus aurantiacus TaxID=3103948 RepID=UPI002B3ACA59|nr:helix-turn-helix transcriptional regulator [Algoriphagus sp. D3-2-R+10]MEB2777328.1 helix-turn-helix transcriptional regulator [Algoriphagus sp. D3-2-R+10]